MKKTLLTIICCCLFTALFAQQADKTTVRGIVTDSVTHKPLAYVTVALVKITTKLPVKSTLTKEDGLFEIKNVTADTYQLTLAYIGYATKNLTVKADGKLIDIGHIVLSATSHQLKDVTVSALKPLMKREVDRLSYDVQADPESKSLTALDMMRKVPLLSVDASDNIKLRGSDSYKILLNGKESGMMTRNPSDVLKAMPATNVVKIEVITSPPAKYDAEGLAGIINIITQKNADQGYNGSVNSSYNTVWGYHENLNATVKEGKFGLSGYVGTGKAPFRPNDYDYHTTFLNNATGIYQYGSNYFGGGSNTYANTELSYEIDTLNLLTGNFSMYNNNNNPGNTQFTQLLDGNGNSTQFYSANNTGTGQWQGGDISLNYQLGFKRNKDQLLTLSYKYSYGGSKQFNDVMTDQTGVANYRQNNNADSKEYTTQLDYVHPMKLISLEAGGKMILRNNSSDFTNDVQDASGAYITDPSQSNNFNYHQDVYSVYNSYTLKFTKWVFKAGLRFERTNINADFTTPASGFFEQLYNNLVPSISAQRNFANNNSLNFGFTQRIQRPGIFQLNPFTNRSNPLYITVGNPKLRPAVNNNFELSYTILKKGSINISGSYSFANNTIQRINTVNGNITTQTYDNIGKSRRAGLDLNTNYPLTKKMNLNVNAELLRVWLEGTINGDLYKAEGYQGHLFTSAGYKFDDGYRIGLNLGFDSRYVLLQGGDNYWIGGGASVSKELFKGKGSINLSANNPFQKFLKLDFTTKTADLVTYNTWDLYYRSFNLSFNYKFGKLKSTIKKNQRGIKNDDTSSGGKN